jgi:branched-chain amino acid transport system ATP-binding protein
MTLGNVLRCSDLELRYGEVRAVAGVNLRFSPGQITAVVGANGAGKSSLLGMLGGALSPAAGSIHLGDRRIDNMSTSRVARLGVLRTFQDGQLFDAMSVREALTIAVSGRMHTSAISRVFFLPGARSADRAIGAEVDRLVAAFRLAVLQYARIGELSLGQAKIVLLASVAAARPQWALLDEPGAALARAEVPGVAEVIRSLIERDPGMGVVLVEHDGELVRSVADRVVVMEQGRVIEDLRRDDPGWAEILGGTMRGTGSRRPSLGDAVGSAPPSVPEPAPSAAVEAAPSAAAEPDSAAGIAVSGCTVSYQRVVACHDIALTVARGEMVGLVGSNGAGKSTILRAIMGLTRPDTGTVTLAGADVGSLAPHSRARRGLALIAGGRGLLPQLTVRENIELGARLGHYRRRHFEAAGIGDVDPYELFPALRRKASLPAGLLSGGEQQMVAIARSLSASPEFLMIDELSLGLSYSLVSDLFAVLGEMSSRGLALLIVDQNYKFVLERTSRCYVLAQGRVIFSGSSSAALARNDLFRPVFLGDDQYEASATR